jgi:muramoyltetrapeptide carboxypeptidase
MPHHIPPLLQPGDPIHIIAPSGAFDHTLFRQGCALIESQGYVPVVPEEIFASHRYLAGDVHTRIKTCTRALQDPFCKVLWAARGGFGAAQLLPHIEPLLRGKKLPWLVGFSDITAWHAVWHQHRTASVHGANITTLPTWSLDAIQNLFNILTEGACHTPFSGNTLLPGPSAQGTVFAGNLTVLASLCGTPYMPRFTQPTLLLLEDIHEPPYKVERCLTQLQQNGFFTHVHGLVLGQFTHCEERSNPDVLSSMFKEFLQPLGIPVLTGVPVGHEESSQSIICGLKGALLMDDEQRLVYEE